MVTQQTDTTMNRLPWQGASSCSYPACVQQEQLPEQCLHGTGSNYPLCVAALSNHLLTTQGRAQLALFDGDLIKAYLLAEIHSRHPVAQARHGQDGPSYAYSNIHSLAEATGVPREPVRRKVMQLIADGWVLRLKNGSLLLSGQRQADYHQLLLQQARLLHSTAAKLQTLQHAASKTGADNP